MKESTGGGSPALRREGKSARTANGESFQEKTTRNVQGKIFFEVERFIYKTNSPYKP